MGFVQGSARKGAVATTAAHDSHNPIAAGGRSDIRRWLMRSESGWGHGHRCGRRSSEMLPLPIAGLMAVQPLEVGGTLETLKTLAAAWGSTSNPSALSFLPSRDS